MNPKSHSETQRVLILRLSSAQRRNGQRNITIRTHNPLNRSPQTQGAQDFMDDADRDFQTSQQSQAKIMADSMRLLQLAQQAATSAEASANQIASMASGGASQAQLLAATKQLQETQMSFNLQYLQLQNQMQNENRQYTEVSNIMKTKHDTVKNSISNIK